jgi:glycine cleavage system H protein
VWLSEKKFTRSNEMADYEVKAFLKYTKDHAWVKKSGDVYRVGITDYAQQKQGAILYADLPSEDDEITAGTSYGSIESGKAVSDLIAPISGKVTAVNEDVIDDPETINRSCYDVGWLIEVEASDYESDEANLIDGEGYKAVIAE